jgi:hypothetical protein
MADEKSSLQQGSRVRPIQTWVLAILAAITCWIPVVLFAISQISIESSLWPFPGLYFLEILAFGVLGLISVVKDSPAGNHPWTGLPWIGAGGLLAFVILGAWTIGFYLVPAMILLITVGVVEDRRKKDNLSLHVILFLAAAFVQAAIVLLVVSVNVS